MSLLRLVGREIRLAIQQTIINGVARAYCVPRPVRFLIYRLIGIETQSWRIMSHCYFGGTQVTIGKRSFINLGCFLDCAAPIAIGNDVHMAPNVSVLTSGHDVGASSRRAGHLQAHPVTIGDGCWIGSSVTILPGVSVGKGCIVAAGAVVTKNCEPDGLYIGVPAARAKDLYQ
jgi:maltose O-acetyltransferase